MQPQLQLGLGRRLASIGRSCGVARDMFAVKFVRTCPDVAGRSMHKGCRRCDFHRRRTSFLTGGLAGSSRRVSVQCAFACRGAVGLSEPPALRICVSCYLCGRRRIVWLAFAHGVACVACVGVALFAPAPVGLYSKLSRSLCSPLRAPTGGVVPGRQQKCAQ